MNGIPGNYNFDPVDQVLDGVEDHFHAEIDGEEEAQQPAAGGITAIPGRIAAKLGDMVTSGWQGKNTVWPKYDLSTFKTRVQLEKVIGKVQSQVRNEQIKAVGKGVIALVGAAALLSMAYTVANVAMLVVGLATFPLAVVPPLYGAVVILSGMMAGGLFAGYTVKALWNDLMGPAVEHWNHAKHLEGELGRLEEKLKTMPAPARAENGAAGSGQWSFRDMLPSF